jgi:hypothetical protein
LLLLPVLGLLLMLGCHDNTPPPWPWWTKQDQDSVAKELTAWRDSISTRFFIENGIQGLADSTTIISRDSVSATRDTLAIKVRRLLGFGLKADDATRHDSLMFGVTVDSLTTDTICGDTFCHVIAIDSSATGFCMTSYNEYWLLRYKPDTSVVGPETTITYKLISQQLVAADTQAQKPAPWKATRYLYLRKDGADYSLTRMSGFSLYAPNTTNAPALRYIALTYQGMTDTFLLSARANRKGIYNLRHKDSLYTVQTGEPLTVLVKTDKPKLKGDMFYFIARIDTLRTILGKDTLGATRNVSFSSPGIKHLVIEVIPQSNIFYPASDFTATIWSLPILVK